MTPEIKIDIGSLAKPFTKLVEVVAQGIGAVYRPIGTVREARAEATASLILAEGDLQKQELLQRAAARLGHVEVQRQQNIESIVEKAQLALPEAVSNEPVNKDWINFFFGACQDVSDSDLQAIWAKLLAGEIAQPGNVPKRALEFLKTFEHEEAIMFEALMAVSFRDSNDWRLILLCETTSAVCQKLAPGRALEQHFSDIGLLAAEPSILANSKTTWSYGAKRYRFAFPPHEPSPTFGILYRPLTAIGQTLARVAKQTEQDGFVLALSQELHQTEGIGLEEVTGSQPVETVITPDDNRNTGITHRLRDRVEHLKKLDFVPRTLTEDEKALIVAVLENVPRQPLTVGFLGSDFEAKQYAKQIKTLLESCGFTVVRLEGFIQFDVAYGLGMTIHGTDSNNPTAIGIRAAFVTAGLAMSMTTQPGPFEPPIALSVFGKPPG